VVVYSGARYPMAALVLSAENTMSFVRRFCKPESASNGLHRWSIRTFSAVMFWWIRDGLFALYPCKYAIPAQEMNKAW
jgi:hypothetical protein